MGKMSLRVLVADDHEIIREALCRLLKNVIGAMEVEQAATLYEVWQLLGTAAAFDLIIVDLIMPGDREHRINRGALWHSSDGMMTHLATADSDPAFARLRAWATLPASLHGFLPKSLTTAQITLALSGLIWELDRTVGGAIASRIFGRCGSG